VRAATAGAETEKRGPHRLITADVRCQNLESDRKVTHKLPVCGSGCGVPQVVVLNHKIVACFAGRVSPPWCHCPVTSSLPRTVTNVCGRCARRARGTAATGRTAVPPSARETQPPFQRALAGTGSSSYDGVYASGRREYFACARP